MDDSRHLQGLSADDYFGLLRRIFVGFRVPPQLQQPKHQFIIGAALLKRAIEQANPGLNDSELALTCTGPYLKEVELCVSKGGQPQPCSDIRGCSVPSLRIPAIR